MHWHYLYIFFLLSSITHSLIAQEASNEDLSPHSDARLLSESVWVEPGKPFTVGLHLLMDEGWHSYWQNPGDSGEPTDIEWALAAGFETGPLQWPYPHAIDAEPLRSYGYSEEVLLLAEIIPPQTLTPGTAVQLEGTAYWLICADICLPAEAPISLNLPVKSAPSPLTSEASLFANARADMPVSMPSWSIEATGYSGSYVLQITPPSGKSIDMEGAYFFPIDDTAIEHASPQPISKEGNSYLIALQQSEYATGKAERLSGVLVAGEGKSWDSEGSTRAIKIDTVVQEASSVVSVTNTSYSYVWLLVMAFIGGMLLNLMPCVFPVLSLKILGFASHSDQNQSSMRRQGLLFGAGVIASFWVLAGLLLFLRTAGSQIGWGFQLQSPFFVAAMALLFFAIGLNLTGLFEVGAGLMRRAGEMSNKAGTNHQQRAFLDGVLATLVATPCTAPFMGAALGAAIFLPPLEALLIFTMLGVGMAIPYVALSFMPGVLKRLPRPGSWMETMKQILSFPMFATTIWLIWVFGQQTGMDGMVLLLSGMLLLGIALWIVGKWPGIQISARLNVLTRSVALIILLLAFSMVYMGATMAPSSQVETSYTDESSWQPFSTTEVDQLRAAGKPVFIDFTAAWCLTCQVNKRTALNTAAVQEAFHQKGVTLFQADWTNRDDEITQALELHGRSGVPLYVLYTSANKKPILLPEILTESILLDALEVLPNTPVASLTFTQP